MFTACCIMHRRCCLPAPEDGRNYRPKQVELIEIINKLLLLHQVGYLYNWQMGFNSVFKGLSIRTLCYDRNQEITQTRTAPRGGYMELSDAICMKNLVVRLK